MQAHSHVISMISAYAYIHFDIKQSLLQILGHEGTPGPGYVSQSPLKFLEIPQLTRGPKTTWGGYFP